MKKMKSIYIALPLLVAGTLFFSSCHNLGKKSSAFELSGTLTQAGEGIKIYLDRLLPDTTQHIDSTTLDKDGKFTFNTRGIYKGFYTLRINQQDYVTLILDSAEKVTVTGNAQNLGYTYTVDGSPDSKLFWEFNMTAKTNMMKRDSLQRLFQALVNTMGGNKERLDSLNDAFEKPYDALMNEEDIFVKSFIRQHINSFACLAASMQLSPDKDIAYYASLDSALSKNYQGSVYLQRYHSMYVDMASVAIGAMAPDITLPDTTGKMVSLSSRINHSGARMDGPTSEDTNHPDNVSEVVNHIHQLKKDGLGVIGMKLCGGGQFQNSHDDRVKAMRFAFQNAGVEAVTVGFKSTQEIDEAINNMNLALA